MLAPLRLLKQRQARRRLDRDIRLNAQAATAPLTDPVPEQLAFHPTGPGHGSFSAGQAMLSGVMPLSGQRIPFQAGRFWDARLPNQFAFEAAHGFAWLKDLAVLGTPTSTRLAQRLVSEWVERFAAGTGKGWQPGPTGQRAMALVLHHRVVFSGLSQSDQAKLLSVLARHRTYLDQRAKAPDHDTAVLSGLSGLIFCHLALGSDPAEAARDFAMRLASASKGLTSRAPEDVMHAFSDLVAVRAALGEAGVPLEKTLEAVGADWAAGLRYLRLGDGSLPRFHGGGAGAEGRLDRLLSDSGVRATFHPKLWMGYARLTGGRVVAVVDCAKPALRHHASSLAHAGTLSFELTSGRRAMVVNCGPGRGAENGWPLRARETASHSTVALDTAPSSTFAPPDPTLQVSEAILIDGPKTVTLDRGNDASGHWLTATHDGYAARYNLIHERRILVEAQGREVRGEDLLRPPSTTAKTKERNRLRVAARLGIPATVRFHLHPDVSIVPHRSADRLGLRLKSGEYWEFDCSGGTPSVEDSLFVETAQSAPVQTRQIVIRARTNNQNARFLWRFLRADMGRRSLRDLQRDDGVGPGG